MGAAVVLFTIGIIKVITANYRVLFAQNLNIFCPINLDDCIIPTMTDKRTYLTVAVDYYTV